VRWRLVSFCLLSHSHRVHLTPSLRQSHARPCPRCLSPLHIVIFPTGRKGPTLGDNCSSFTPQWLLLQILVWGQHPLSGPLAAGAAYRCRSTSADLSAVCAELSRDTRSTFSDTRHLTYLCAPYRCENLLLQPPRASSPLVPALTPERQVLIPEPSGRLHISRTWSVTTTHSSRSNHARSSKHTMKRMQVEAKPPGVDTRHAFAIRSPTTTHVPKSRILPLYHR
jgi:hypothetical protein